MLLEPQLISNWRQFKRRLYLTAAAFEVSALYVKSPYAVEAACVSLSPGEVAQAPPLPVCRVKIDCMYASATS